MLRVSIPDSPVRSWPSSKAGPAGYHAPNLQEFLIWVVSPHNGEAQTTLALHEGHCQELALQLIGGLWWRSAWWGYHRLQIKKQPQWCLSTVLTMQHPTEASILKGDVGLVLDVYTSGCTHACQSSSCWGGDEFPTLQFHANFLIECCF